MTPNRRSTYHHGHLRETLITLTVAMLDGMRAEDVTLRALAERAGVSGMAPYRHFRDRDSLMAAAADAGFDLLQSRLATSVEGVEDAHQAVVAFATAYVSFALARPNLFRVMFASGAPLPDPEMHDATGRMFDPLADRVAQLVPEERRGETLLAAWSLVHGLASLAVAGRFTGENEEPTDLVARLAGMLLPPSGPAIGRS